MLEEVVVLLKGTKIFRIYPQHIFGIVERVKQVNI